MQHLNLGIVAHVDAGKTSLTERILYDAGVLDVLGSVDAGTTRTDSMDLERRRGITIRSAVTSFVPARVPGLTINLVDTPGHPDFIGEVERALAVLDGAVLVLSAVEGVQPQSVVIWRALQRLRVPTLIFLNKMDRAAADPVRALSQVRDRLHPDAVTMTRTHRSGTPGLAVRALAPHSAELTEIVAGLDDRLLSDWVVGRQLRPRAMRGALRAAVRDQRILPVLAGSAITGAGVPELAGAIAGYLPWAPSRPEAEPSGMVFKIDQDQQGKRVFLRMRSGTVAVRERLSLAGRPAERITDLAVFRSGSPHSVKTVTAGEIAMVRGLSAARIGDMFGRDADVPAYRFPPATVESIVEPVDVRQRGAMFAALTDLASMDPLIALRSDDDRGAIAIDLHGEVQKEVIAALLAENYGIPVVFRASTVLCIERVVDRGAAVDMMGGPDNPYLATIGLRVGPAPQATGLTFDLEVERGAMPPAFFAATEEGVRAALRAGLAGWAVPDCRVTMTHSAYCPRQSHAHQPFNKNFSSVGADFRNLAPIVVMAALDRAGTTVCEPVNRFDLQVPTDTMPQVLAALGRLDGVALSTRTSTRYTQILGSIPAGRVGALAAKLPVISHGEGVLTSELDHHRPVRAGRPQRPRTGPDPRDRARWTRLMPR